MPAFPRTIGVQRASSFLMPGALQSWSQSGKAQSRSTVQVGRMWTETLRPFLAGSIEGRALIAFLNNAWRNGTGYTISHPSYLTPNGGATGTILVNGASQTGSTLNVDGVTGSSPGLRAGDIISVNGIAHVFDATADVNISAGAMAIPINPPIFAGGSPADNAAVTITAVQLNAKLASAPDIPPAGPDGFIADLVVVHRETP